MTSRRNRLNVFTESSALRFATSVALAVTVLGVGLFIIGSSLEAGGPRVVGNNLPINSGATDRRDISAHNSPKLVRNPAQPNNLVVASAVDPPRIACALHASLDGGATWAETSLPSPGTEELADGCSNLDVAFGPEGTLYASFVTIAAPGNLPTAVWTMSSRDGGRTLSPPVNVQGAGPLAFQVRLAADPVKPNRLYLTWLQALEASAFGFPQTGNPILFSYSDDGGISWQPAATVTGPDRPRAVAPSIAVGPGDRLYLLYLDLKKDSLDYAGEHHGTGGDASTDPWALVLARSSDSGSTWQETMVEPKLVPTERFLVFEPPSPSLAIDQRTGRIYAAFHDGRHGDPDVLVWRSSDQGRTFAPGRRVNDTRLGDQTFQYLPTLAITQSGRLDVLYYDRRRDDRNVLNEASLQSSSDGGAQFTDRVPVSDHAFDSGLASANDPGLANLGHRLGLVSDDQRALAVWTDTRGGIVGANKQDLARAVIRFSDSSRLRDPFRYIGLTLAFGAMTSLLIRPLRRRR